MLAEVEKDLGCGKGNGETERCGRGGGAGAHLELVLWNHVVVSQSVQQRKRVVYRHRDFGAVQSQQAAQCPIPARHRFEADCVSAPPSGMCALACLGCPGTISGDTCENIYLLPSWGKATLGLLHRSVILSTRKERRLLFTPGANQGPVSAGWGQRLSYHRVQESLQNWYSFPMESRVAAWARGRAQDSGRKNKVSPAVSLQRVLFMGKKNRTGWEDAQWTICLPGKLEDLSYPIAGEAETGASVALTAQIT